MQQSLTHSSRGRYREVMAGTAGPSPYRGRSSVFFSARPGVLRQVKCQATDRVGVALRLCPRAHALGRRLRRRAPGRRDCSELVARDRLERPVACAGVAVAALVLLVLAGYAGAMLFALYLVVGDLTPTTSTTTSCSQGADRGLQVTSAYPRRAGRPALVGDRPPEGRDELDAGADSRGWPHRADGGGPVLRAA